MENTKQETTYIAITRANGRVVAEGLDQNVLKWDYPRKQFDVIKVTKTYGIQKRINRWGVLSEYATQGTTYYQTEDGRTSHYEGNEVFLR